MVLKFEKYSEEEKLIWENINIESKHSTFLSSIEWINFQKLLGKEIDQYFVTLDQVDKSLKIGILYIEIFRRKLIKYAYSPYQPVFLGEDMNDQELSEVYLQIKKFMQKYIEEHDLTLFRFDPLLQKKYTQNLLNLGFKASLAPAQAKDVFEINIEASEEELRANMSKSTRYNINKTSRNSLELIKATSEKEIKAFANLMKETTQRKGFGNYDYEYFRKQFNELNPKGIMDIFLVKYKNPVTRNERFLSGALINYYKDTAYYTHGASTSDHELSKLRSPYFLQWEIIKYVKSNGFKKYNMWGIIPKEKESQTIQDGNGNNKLKTPNPLQGVSDFKKSFALPENHKTGYEINYVGPFEVYNQKLKYFIHRTIDWWIYKKDRY